MKRLLILIPILFLLSCVSEHEKEAINELSPLGGEITISNGITSSTNNRNVKFKKIIVKCSGAVDEGVIEPDILASKFAFTIFNKLNDSERDFDKIEVELNKSDGTTYTYEISKSKIESLEKEYKHIDNWISEIKNNKIDNSYKYLSSLSPATPKYERYKDKFEHLNKKFGTIESVWFDGYIFEQVNHSSFQGEIHQLIYDFRTKNGVYAIHVFIDPNAMSFS